MQTRFSIPKNASRFNRHQLLLNNAPMILRSRNWLESVFALSAANQNTSVHDSSIGFSLKSSTI